MKEFDTVIMFMSGVGTTLCAIHGYDAIVAAYPQCTPRLYLVVSGRSVSLYKDILAAYPQIHVVPTGPTHRWSAVRSMVRLVTKRNFVITNPTLRGNPQLLRVIAFILSRRGGVYAGFETTISARLLQDYTAVLSVKKNVFQAIADIVSSVSGTQIEVPIQFRFQHDQDIMVRYGVQSGGYVVVHPFAGSPVRELSHARWLRILRSIATQYPHTTIFISGAEKDKAQAESLCVSANLGSTIINVAGHLSIQEVASLISHAVAYLGVDTGITHLASVLRIPAVVIGNNSNPYWLPTYSNNTTILTANDHCVCDGTKRGTCLIEDDGQKRYRCMVDVSDERILEALREKIEQKTP